MANWVQVEGAATSIGVDDAGNMVCCNAGGQMFEKTPSGPWQQMDGAATMVARGRDGTTWCVNAEQNIWRRQEGKWNQMPGAAVFVSVGSFNQVLVINASQQIFRWEGAGWQQMDGAAVTGSIGADGTIIVVNSAHQVFRRDGAAWTLLPNCNGGVPAVVSRGQMYITNKAARFSKASTVATRGKVFPVPWLTVLLLTATLLVATQGSSCGGCNLPRPWLK